MQVKFVFTPVIACGGHSLILVYPFLLFKILFLKHSLLIVHLPFLVFPQENIFCSILFQCGARWKYRLKVDFKFSHSKTKESYVSISLPLKYYA